MEGISDMVQERRQRSIVVIIGVVVTRSTERTLESAYVKWSIIGKGMFPASPGMAYVYVSGHTLL